MNTDSAPAASVFGTAVQWLQATLLGTVATTICVIAVGSVGFMLLAGRIDVRRAAQVILGCFVLFGASTIAAGFVRFAESGNVTATIPPSQPSPLLYASPVAKTPTTAVPYDPYAGAALPTR